MYPNPQDVLPLPPRPDVEQYRTRAKELVRAHRREGAAAVEAWAQRWIEALWHSGPADASIAPPYARDVDRSARQVTAFAMDRLGGTRGALSQAQFVIARAHGFPSWTRFVRHLDAVTAERSETATFERAADAVVQGDRDGLLALLRSDPELVRARSDREHGATLLHYVSANGVEHYRQRTPPNIVEITTHLLDAGADVRATCDVYGGDADTLGLVVTSSHPRAAGVQLALADLLVARGAQVRPGIVRDCLANGCPEAAVHMSALCIARNVPLQLQELAGAGLSDRLGEQLSRRTFDTAELSDAMQMAAWYDRRQALEVLLDHGVPVDVAHPQEGKTALHVACYAGSAEAVRLLLARGASVLSVDRTHGTQPLVWALHAWLVDERTPDDVYRTIVMRLLDAGAEVRAEWVDDDRLRKDTELYVRLRERISDV